MDRHKWQMPWILGNLLIMEILVFLVQPALTQALHSQGSSELLLKVNVDLVTLNLAVRDSNRCFIDHLRREDLSLWEDGVPQQITNFDSESLPLYLIILLDLSSSTKPFFREMKTAAQQLADLLTPEDEIAVIAFSNLPWVLEESTHRKSFLPLALERVQSSFSGATNIFDSVYLAARKLETLPPQRRRLIVLISDGQGNRGEPERAFRELRASGATVIGIGVGSKNRLPRAITTFNRLVKETGGRVLQAGSLLRSSLEAALQQMRSSYAIGFVSSNKKQDGQFRQLRIAISQESPLAARGLTLEGPAGYVAAEGPRASN